MYKLYFLILIGFYCATCKPTDDKKFNSWPVYGGSKENIRYSNLNQIDTSNVSQLKVAWVYNSEGADTVHGSQIQCNPIVIDGILYGVNPNMVLFAIDAATGEEKWKFNVNTDTEFDGNRGAFHIMINSRGIAYWSDGKGDNRIFFTTGSNTFAINATNGKAIKTFGKNGSIDLHDGLDRENIEDAFIVNTSPGIIYKDLIILGTRVNEELPSAPGHIRAYDVRTGQRKWIFHTIPFPNEEGYETWENKEAYKYTGGANVWSGFSLDEGRGIVFCGTGSASYDFYGGNRKGSNLYANCVLALDAATGKKKWHYQVLHHDLWDKDIPTPPALVTLNLRGRKVDAVAQPTKNGYLFVLDRSTGVPIFDTKETAVDSKSDLIGEKVWPTQPIPSKPAPFARQTLTINDINPYVSKEEQADLKTKLNSIRFGNAYVPPGKTPSLVFPGYDGGAEWGGPAFDPKTGIIYINSNEMAWIMQMNDHIITAPQKENLGQAGERLYLQNCASCHGSDRKGTGNNPTLINVKSTYDTANFINLINYGRRMMPGFKRLEDDEKQAIASYVLEISDLKSKPFTSRPIDTLKQAMMPYKMKGYDKFLTKDGYPAISPPWGTLNAINLNTGDYVWKIPFGEHAALKAKGIPATGTENYGGPVVTAGGLLFIAATQDGKFRAYHKATGKLLWEYTLPAPGFATPAVYEIKEKQYLVIACGGGKLGTKSSDQYLAFAL